MDDEFFEEAERKFVGRRVTRILRQRGHTNIPIDRTRKAIGSGRRVSKTGHVYWETRKNRSDQIGKNV